MTEGWMEVKGRSLELEELGDGRKRVREGGGEGDKSSNDNGGGSGSGGLRGTRFL